jgi:aspartate-semialdehyde dehydrogenase
LADLMALVGSETLLGRELRDYLAGYSLGADLRLIASENDAGGVLSEHAGEPAFVSQLNAGSLVDADLILLAGSPDSSRKALELAPKQALIDLTYGLEDDPRSRLRAPLVEPHDFRVPPDAIHSIAHPAAVTLAMLLGCVVMRYKVSCWIAHVFEPASERGASGVEELQGQAVSLLSFKPMPKKIFDAQLAFSMLAALGEEAALKLDDVETRVERHLATLLERSGDGPMPSLRLLQAPVFHGYSFSISTPMRRISISLRRFSRAKTSMYAARVPSRRTTSGWRGRMEFRSGRSPAIATTRVRFGSGRWRII